MRKALINISGTFAAIIVAIFIYFLIAGNISCEEEKYLMGTIVNIKAYGHNSKEAIKLAFDRIKEIEDRLSLNLEGSEVSRINANAGKSTVKVGNDTYNVIRDAIGYAKSTKGVFEPTIGPISALWGIGTGNERVPPDEEIRSLLPLVDYEDISIENVEGDYFIGLRKSGQVLDLGAIAKGYAGDRVVEIMGKSGVSGAVADIGGNIVIYGKKPGRGNWNIGVQNPFASRGQYMGILELELETGSVVTSGSYERFFERNGKRYHHIFDPKTGYPADTDIASVTVVSVNSEKADVLSTALFIMGVDEAMKHLEAYSDAEAIIIAKDKKVYITKGLKEAFRITDDQFSYQER